MTCIGDGGLASGSSIGRTFARWHAAAQCPKMFKLKTKKTNAAPAWATRCEIGCGKLFATMPEKINGTG